MIRRILDFVAILIFVWTVLIIGLWIIASYIVPFQLPGESNAVLAGTLKVVFSAILALIWLWTWREIVRRLFWRTIRKAGSGAGQI